MQIKEQVLLRDWTTFKTGGPSQFFCEVTTDVELAEAVAFAKVHELPTLVLGGGSNVLVSDAGFRGLTIVLKLTGVTERNGEAGEVLVTAVAGEDFDAFVARMVERGYWGLENLSGIPGTVGATPIQNVGAYGVEVGERVVSVRAYDTVREVFVDLSSGDCQFSYRDSVFKHETGAHYIVTAVTFALQVEPAPRLQYRDLAMRFNDRVPTQAEIRDAVLEIRAAKFPDWRTVGTAGSFFKNPIITREHYTSLAETYPELPAYEVDAAQVKVPLGWILDRVLNLKGQGTERVGCYEGQALVVYNRGGATTSDVLAFTDDIARKVYEATGITIEREVRLVE